MCGPVSAANTSVWVILVWVFVKLKIWAVISTKFFTWTDTHRVLSPYMFALNVT